MESVPNVVIAQHTPPPPPSKLKVNPKLIGIVVVVIILGYLIITNIPQFNRKLPSQIRKQPTLQTGATTQLNNLIKKTFSANAGYKNIIDYTNLALNEKDPTKGYYYNRKLYFKILQAYQTTRNPQFNLVLEKVKEYSKVYPQFKEGDFPNPNRNV